MTEEEIVEVMARAMATTEEAVTPWWTFKPEARAILAALRAKGLVVRPMEATEEMIAAAEELNPMGDGFYAKIYRAMIAPTPQGKPFDIGPIFTNAEIGDRKPDTILCSDCPPVGYPTDETRCTPCPRRALLSPAPEQKEG